MIKKILFSLAIAGMLMGSSYSGFHKTPSHETSMGFTTFYVAGHGSIEP